MDHTKSPFNICSDFELRALFFRRPGSMDQRTIPPQPTIGFLQILIITTKFAFIFLSNASDHDGYNLFCLLENLFLVKDHQWRLSFCLETTIFSYA